MGRVATAHDMHYRRGRKYSEDNLEEDSSKSKSKRKVKDDSQSKYKSSDELIEASEFQKIRTSYPDGTGFPTNRERMQALVQITEDAVMMLDGLMRTRPTTNTAYALNSTIERLQALISQCDATYNHAQMAENVYQLVVKPILDEILLTCAGIIRDNLRDMDIHNPKKKAYTKNIMSTTLRGFASAIETTLKDSSIEKRIQEALISG